VTADSIDGCFVHACDGVVSPVCGGRNNIDYYLPSSFAPFCFGIPLQGGAIRHTYIYIVL
jgi:hypothetical protein